MISNIWWKFVLGEPNGSTRTNRQTETTNLADAFRNFERSAKDGDCWQERICNPNQKQKILCWSTRVVEKYPIVLCGIWTPTFNTDWIQATRRRREATYWTISSWLPVGPLLMHSKEVQGVLFLSWSGTQLQTRLEPRDEEICSS
jgi:hypothetical protein